MQKIIKKGKKIDNLENEVKEHEMELKAIKEAFEKKNFNALNTLPIKHLPKSGRLSAKAPKKLSQKEKEKRDEIRRLKEVEDLNKMQQQLFKQVKSRKKIEPIDKKILTNRNGFNIDNDDIFAINLNKDFERIFGNDKTKQPMNNKTVTTTWRKKLSANKNISHKKDKKKQQIIGYPLSAIDRRKKICEKSKEKVMSDKEKDENYLNTLDEGLKIFYLEKTKEIFELLKQIHLSRYIDCFLKEGYDIFEEFIQLPLDFFDKMEKPFLNKEQQEKLFKKLSIFKTKNNINKNEEKVRKRIEEIINKEKAFPKTENNFYKSKIDKPNGGIKENNNLINNNININNNEVILNDTSPLIKKEELFYTNIDELEKQRTEDFKKAVEDWRNNNNTNTNNNNNKDQMSNKESNAPVNESSILVNSPNEMICCWNCFKPIKKENSIQKDYDNKLDKSILFINKNFCNSKCIKEYEKKKKTKIVCFQCNKIFDIYQGFVAHDGDKFCSTDCKNKYIEIEKSIKKNNKQKNKNKNTEQDKGNKNEIQNNNNNKNIDEDYYEGDDYDPMDDF